MSEFKPDNKVEGKLYRNEATGMIRSDDVKLRWDLIPTIGLRRLCKRYTDGAVKYTAHNWRKGDKWTNTYNHIREHLEKFKNGEDLDDDHLAAIAWGCMTLMEYQSTHPELNDLHPPYED